MSFDCQQFSIIRGTLKKHQQIYDYPFNSEIIKITAEGLFTALGSLFNEEELETFRAEYQKLLRHANAERRSVLFKSIAKKFAEGAAKAAGGGVVMVLKSHIGAE